MLWFTATDGPIPTTESGENVGDHVTFDVR